MSGQLVFDDEASRRMEAMYQIGDAVRRRQVVREVLAARPGERVLDVGCGPGFYCAELVRDVGPAGAVTGVDGSAAMLALAARRCAGHDNVRVLQGDATALPVADGGFDAALSVQVQEYVADVGASLAELHRVLRPGGRVLVFDTDWATLSVHTEDPERGARVLAAWDEHLTHRSLPRTLAPRLRRAGFADVRVRPVPVAAIDFHPDAHAAALVALIAAFVDGRPGVAPGEADAWAAEQRALGERGEFYFAFTQFCFTAHKPR